MYTERLLLAHLRILGVGFSSIHLCTRYGYTQRREGLLLLYHAHFLVYYIYSPFNIQAIMSNEAVYFKLYSMKKAGIYPA